MSNIVTTIINYVANVWHNTDQDIVMAEHINGWEQSIQNMSAFLSRYAWHPNTSYPKGSVILYPFGLNTKLVSQNDGVSGAVEPTWSDAAGVAGSRTVTDNNIIWKEMPMEISADITPIGTIKQQLWHTAPPGYVKLDESVLLNRADYPELWAYVQAYMPLITEVEWQKQAAKQDSVGFFSTGDGVTTFRTPVLLDFARGGSVQSVGVYTADQNKEHSHTKGTMNITGTFRATDRNYGGTSGAFKVKSRWSTNYKNGGSDSWGTYNEFNAADTWTGSTSISGGDETRPKNIIMPYFLRTLNV